MATLAQAQRDKELRTQALNLALTFQRQTFHPRDAGQVPNMTVDSMLAAARRFEEYIKGPEVPVQEPPGYPGLCVNCGKAVRWVKVTPQSKRYYLLDSNDKAGCLDTFESHTVDRNFPAMPTS